MITGLFRALQTSTINLFAKIANNVDLKLWTILGKKVKLRCLTGSRICLCRWIKHSSKNSNENISQTASKDKMILISYLHLEFRSVNCHHDLIFFSVAVQNFCSANFLPIIITSSVVEFILSKIPCFPHILMDTFRRMRLKYENYSLRSISF